MKQSRGIKLLSNTLIFTVGKFVSKLIVIFMLPFYTSYLSSAEYSTSDLITNLCNLIIPLACLGVSEGIFRNAADKSVDKESFFTNGAMLMIFGSAGFLALSPLLNFFDYFDAYIWLIILYVIASNMHSVCSQYVCAIGRTKLFAGQGVLNTALTVVLNIIFLVGFNMGIIGYVLSIVLADFLTTVFVFLVAKLYRAFIPSKISRAVMKDLLRFCLPLVPSTIFWWITGVSDRYLVAAMVSDEENGLYAAAYKIPTLLTYVVTIFNDAWKLSAVSESEDRSKCAEFYTQVYKYYIAIMFVGGGALAVCSQLFAKILFADSYFAAWVFIPVLSAATVFTALDTFLGSVYFTVKRTQVSLWTSLLGAIVNVALNLVMIPEWGAMGASIATFISYFAVYIVRAATMGRFMRFNLYHVRLAINTVLIGVIATVMSLYGDTLYGLLISGGVLLVSLIFNGRDIVITLKQILSGVKRRKS
ncbi:MAG: polysaccharide biosynthesis C-terminal domain-containing protein [Clostridia bacterium]|nr:polysaccharide biosynthesis C-terminal domain-containing protein [Clostridia bacterium]